MERTTYLKRYRLCVDQVGIPTIIRRSAGEATFQADEIKSGERVAVQVIPPGALRQTTRAELTDAAEAASKIQHLNIPALREFGFEGEQFVCVTDYFEGTSAQDWVKEKGPLPVSVVLRIASQMVSALNAATFQGAAHHAVTPDNVMLVPGQTAEGEWPLIKVINFLGLEARDKAFVSPEQRQGKAPDFRAQIYSLGCTLWFLLKGAPPPADEEVAAQEAHGLPAPVRRLLLPMLAAEAEARPLDPLVLEEQIQKCLAQIERRDAVASKFGLSPTVAEPAPPIIENYPARRSSRAPIALAAVLAGAAAIGALVVAQRMRWHEAIGIPIGVPAPASEAAAPSVTSSQPSPVITTETIPSASSENSEPPVLTSTAVAEEENLPNESESSVSVASNEMPTEKAEGVSPEPPVESSADSPPDSAPVLAENAPVSEPAPPAEAPPDAAEPSPTPVEMAVVTAATTPEPTVVPVDVQKDVTVSPPVEQPAKATKVAKATKPARKKLPEAPPPPINPALLPNERIYAAPLAPSLREEPRRRPRPIMRDSTRELPVLPALPPDE